ncbi:tryptophan halogenase family protein [Asticcacaulis taihuensis]|uniref:tryptophan halogenase family protein n=1 Tax=Asticcacaulis taihuensis TaxID=260084 RepID=UPI0026F1C9BB|nr:tryptophan halogenase family protein [Asticcacaulis taihuensis]
MPAEPIRKLVILGGGTAGWMAAAMASRTWGKRLSITLVESEAIGTVGVGEATIPPLIKLLRFLGLDEDVTLRNIQGTFKFGIEFDGWRRKGESYMHSFGTPGAPIGIVPFYQYWLRRHLAGEDCGSLWDYSLNTQVSYAGKMSREPRIEGNLPGPERAFHFDAGLLAQFMRRGCEASGVVRHEGKVAGVNLRPEDGFIESLTLESGEIIAGDMFIDCSGFVGVLIEGALKAGYEDWTHWLPCDRAVAVPCALPADKSIGILPYTRSTAHAAGWQWRIPLQHRTGNGHVFCSGAMTNDEAAHILLENLDGEPLADPRIIGFRTGRRKATWVKNCVALGLASGFMEPLESTSIHLVQSVMTRFLDFFPDKDFNPVEIAEFNRRCRREYEYIRDFLVLHYHANERDEPFWRDCRTMAIPDSLAHKMDYFRQHGRLLVEEGDLFREDSWVQVLIGQGIMPKAASPLTETVGQEALASFMSGMKMAMDKAVTAMPSHDAFIARHCAATTV